MKNLIGNKKARGFTLTEMALVLLIVGIILGAIWVAAGHVQTKVYINQTIQEVNQIAKNVRGMYAALPKAPRPTTAKQRSFLPTGGVNAWGGTYAFVFSNPIGSSFGLRVNLPATLDPISSRELCLDLFTRLPSTGGKRNPAQGDGPLSVQINGGSFLTTLKSAMDRMGSGRCSNIIFTFAL